jgi:predicted ATPase
LAILLHLAPPPLVVIEEPEAGLHPDALVCVLKLMQECVEKSQLIVVTLSMTLVDSLTGCEEAVMVAGRTENST